MKGIYNRSATVLAVFILVNGLAFAFKGFLQGHGVDIGLLLVANLILFLLGLAGFFILMRGLRSSNTQAFLRSVYASLLLKLFVIIIALSLYLFINKGKINRPALFTSLALYIVYMVIEIRQLMKITSKKTDA
ncbi:MAG TPA: hypothetical protein VG847_05005 [Chitinophagaceae bacterium]|nr:hypothetical protein [Chitinophagaceae bacterium]